MSIVFSHLIKNVILSGVISLKIILACYALVKNFKLKEYNLHTAVLQCIHSAGLDI